MKKRIYLDNNASTKVHPKVVEAITNYLNQSQGNPSSTHSFGREARSQLMMARQTIADYLGVNSKQLIFTSGGTEALNLVIKGIFNGNSSGHFITSDVEHAAVYQTAQKLSENHFCNVTFLKVGLNGAILPEQVEAAIRPDTKLISLMAVNNETGVKTDIESIAKIAKKHDIPFLVDAIAWLGKEQIKIPEGVTAMCFNAQKCHGPQGIGAAFIRSSLKLEPLLFGGEQEYFRRAGTENMPGIIGFAQAIKQVSENQTQAGQRMRLLRDKLEHALLELPHVFINGSGERICNTTNIAFDGIDGETLLQRLDEEGVAASHGSACASGALEPSRVLLNMGYPRKRVESSLRFSLSYFTTEDEIDKTIIIIRSLINQLRM